MVRLLLALSIVLGCAACALSSGEEQSQEVVVFAASSLTDVFTAIEGPFEAAHPGLDLRLNFAGSQTLRLQIEQGARTHIFASANAEHAEALVRSGLADEVAPFAHSPIALVVAGRSSGARLERLKDLPAAKRIVVGSDAVPIGRYTDEILRRASELFGPDWRAQVESRIVSQEPNVRLVRTRVEQGEADAALLYRSDLAGRSNLREVTLPPSVQLEADYVLARIPSEGREAAARDAFVAFLFSNAGRALLRDFWFTPARPR